MTGPFSLEDKTVVVTGGGRGIGRGISECVAEAGATAVLVARTPEPLHDTVAAIAAAGGRAHAVIADLATHQGISHAVREANERLGYIDCWINNAGNVLYSDLVPLLDVDDDNWHRTVDLNFKWPFFAAQAAARSMSRGGSIVNVTSLNARTPSPTGAHYGAAKAGLERLTHTMAIELGHLGIRVNAVAPGFVLTEKTRATRKGGEAGEADDPLFDILALQRYGVPRDVGAACVYLAAEASSFVTGVVLPVDGGQLVSANYSRYMTSGR